MLPKATTKVDQIIGSRIMAVRKAKSLSQTDLGKAIGVTFQQVQKYEKGSNRIGAGRLQEIAKFLKVSVQSLYKSETETAEDSDSIALLTSPGAVGLLQAFVAIDDLQLRREILAIVLSAARMSGGHNAKET